MYVYVERKAKFDTIRQIPDEIERLKQLQAFILEEEAIIAEIPGKKSILSGQAYRLSTSLNRLSPFAFFAVEKEIKKLSESNANMFEDCSLADMGGMTPVIYPFADM